MIWIIGGTSETAQVVEQIREQVDYIVTVTSVAGQEMLADAQVRVERMDYAAMLDFFHTHPIDLVVDLSHPYAAEVSQNARRACRDADIRYIRFVRKPSETTGAVYVSSLEECLAFLNTVKGCVFFTTGSKNIADFEQMRGNNRFVYRVLPTPDSLEMCVRHQIAMRDIVAILGPISEALNIAMFSEYQADYVVMKNSGSAGGTPEKVVACQRLGIKPVIIGRPDDEGVSDLKQVIAEILQHQGSK
jgi:precorrin-6A/cobalt-precorrin-6A reductase